ncbi:hypothetical protein C427_4033 [Paraglaciecola psychrophila 170]|uniref:Uncharacterized protein n=1 Tax=Paraglaciecola psychrophila 170 TaxID=1129794 RepID=M4RU03_9ALTE|nr:hypothetical protein C427_4033 [Paraglaciecola psychrophila 170]
MEFFTWDVNPVLIEFFWIKNTLVRRPICDGYFSRFASHEMDIPTRKNQTRIT